ncbi:MAG: biopolymer transporter ExbD [Lentisphaerales bacterium]|nr:biopolymer transporter ExbD [Lentisphaerales bacterium]
MSAFYLNIATVVLLLTVPAVSFAEDAGGSTSAENSFQQLSVSIGEHGNIFLEGSAVSSKQLKSFINQLPNAEDYEITVLAHEEADSTQVLNVMNICCNYKVAKVKLVYTPNWDHKG